VPTADVSAQEQALIGAPLPPINDHPNDAAAWKALIKTRADQIVKTLPDAREVRGEIRAGNHRGRELLHSHSRQYSRTKRT
jgi:hypothetical protein